MSSTAAEMSVVSPPQPAAAKAATATSDAERRRPMRLEGIAHCSGRRPESLHAPVRFGAMAAPTANLADIVGDTPMVTLTRVAPDCGAELVAKLEAYNPAGSVKDRIGVAMIDAAEAEGRIEPGQDHDRRGRRQRQHRHRAGVRLRRPRLRPGAGHAAGHEPRARGAAAAVRRRGARSPSRWAGWTRRSRPRRSIAAENAATRSSATSSPTPPTPRSTAARPPRRSGATWTAGWTCWCAGVGTGGTITGAGERLKELNPDLHVVAVEPESSPVIVGRPARARTGSRASAPASCPPVLNRDIVDEVIARVRRGRDRDRPALRARPRASWPASRAAPRCAAAIEVGIAARDGRASAIVVVMPDSGERYVSAPFFDPA